MEGLGREGVAHKKVRPTPIHARVRGKEQLLLPLPPPPTYQTTWVPQKSSLHRHLPLPRIAEKNGEDPKHHYRSLALVFLLVFFVPLFLRRHVQTDRHGHTRNCLFQKRRESKKRRANIGLLRLRRGKKKKVWRCFLSFPLSSIPFSLPFSSAKIFPSPASSPSSKVLKCSRRTWQQVFRLYSKEGTKTDE